MVGAVSSGRIRRPGGGAGVPARSPRHTSAPRAKLPLSIHVRSCPFSSFLYCPVGCGTASPGTRPTSPRSRTRLFWFPRPYFSSCVNCSPSLVYPKQAAHLQYYGYTSPTGDECRAEPRERGNVMSWIHTSSLACPVSDARQLRSMNPSPLGWYGVVRVLCIPNKRHTSSTTATHHQLVMSAGLNHGNVGTLCRGSIPALWLVPFQTHDSSVL